MAEEQLDLEGKSVEDLKNLLEEKQSLLEQVTRERDKAGDTIYNLKTQKKEQETRAFGAEVHFVNYYIGLFSFHFFCYLISCLTTTESE